MPALAEHVPRVRTVMMRAARSLGADERLCKRIALAVSEAATNAVLHAYPDRRPGEIQAQLIDRDGEYEVVVTDHGGGLAPRRDSPGLGMGLGIIADVCDDLQIVTDPSHGTEVHMIFRPRPR